jgi:hypothetical protein
MLDAYIIEEIKRRERERAQRERARPTVDIPVERNPDDDRQTDREAPVKRRTVVTIEL